MYAFLYIRCMTQPSTTTPVPHPFSVTEELVFAVTRRSSLDFGTVANVLFATQSHYAETLAAIEALTSPDLLADPDALVTTDELTLAV